MNLLADSSFADVKATIASEPWLAAFFDVGETYIRSQCRRVSFVFAGLRHNLDSINSEAKFSLLWVDGAESGSANAWTVTIPTVREKDAEIWVTWNRSREQLDTYCFWQSPPNGSSTIELNWRTSSRVVLVLERTGYPLNKYLSLIHI